MNPKMSKKTKQRERKVGKTEKALTINNLSTLPIDARLVPSLASMGMVPFFIKKAISKCARHFGSYVK